MLSISSTAFTDNSSLPPRYTCDGEGVNPPLAWSGVPDETQSLALIVDDPDAPSGTFDHWILFNIPPDTASIEEGSEPACVHGTGTLGNKTYFAPCPPSGEHRYRFTLYALDTTLPLQEGANKNKLLSAMEGHIIEQTTLVGKCRR